jgi:glutathione S-transferase
MVHYKLTYFNGRGRAEIVRLIFAVAGVEYEDVRLDKEKWPALKPSTPFGQVPIIEFEGKTFCQSNAIGRYLARKFNVAGKTDVEQLEADMIVDCMEDGLKPFITLFGEKDEARKAELKKKYAEEQLPVSFAGLESILKSNKGGDGFFVGDSLTWADLAFLMFVSWSKMSGNETLLDNYPKLKALEKRVESVPKVAAWIAKRPVTEF